MDPSVGESAGPRWFRWLGLRRSEAVKALGSAVQAIREQQMSRRDQEEGRRTARTHDRGKGTGKGDRLLLS